MLYAAYTAAALAILTIAACIEHTPPRQVWRHLKRFPGTLLVGSFGGASIAIACWGLGLLLDHLLWPVTQSRFLLGVIAALWLGIYTVMDTGEQRRKDERRKRRQDRRARVLAGQGKHRITPSGSHTLWAEGEEYIPLDSSKRRRSR